MSDLAVTVLQMMGLLMVPLTFSLLVYVVVEAWRTRDGWWIGKDLMTANERRRGAARDE